MSRATIATHAVAPRAATRACWVRTTPTRPFGFERTRHHEGWRKSCDQARLVAGAASNDDQVLEGNRAFQIGGSKLLMKLLEADDTRAVAKEIAGEMDDGFFNVGATYLDMAKKEKQLEVAAKIESALKIAMEEKNNTLRPEIKLLNQLIAEPKSFRRKQLLNTKAAGDTLQMNDGYFFTVLARITADVENQPSNPQKEPLLNQLQDIKLEAKGRLPASPRGFGKS